jgi:hypothetical protein
MKMGLWLRALNIATLVTGRINRNVQIWFGLKLEQLWMGRITARLESVQRNSLLRVSAVSQVRGVRGGRQSGLQRQRRPALRSP